MAEYELIDIKDETNGTPVKKQARKITRCLAIGYTNQKYGDLTYKIYSIHAHHEAIKHRIKTWSDAVKIALFLHQVYGEFWDIHDLEDWKKADIIQIAQYSVPMGIETFVSLKSLEDRDTITMEDLERALEKINEIS